MDNLKLITAYLALLFMATLGPAQLYQPPTYSLTPMAPSVPIVLFYHQGALLIAHKELIRSTAAKNSTASSSYD